MRRFLRILLLTGVVSIQLAVVGAMYVQGYKDGYLAGTAAIAIAEDESVQVP